MAENEDTIEAWIAEAEADLAAGRTRPAAEVFVELDAQDAAAALLALHQAALSTINPATRPRSSPRTARTSGPGSAFRSPTHASAWPPPSSAKARRRWPARS